MSSDSDDDLDVVVYTPHEMLVLGLGFQGFSENQVYRVKDETSQTRLRSHYGLNSVGCAQLWEDLQTTPCLEARINPKKRCIKMFFQSLHFLRCYPTEDQRDGKWFSKRKNRDDGWYYVERIGALKRLKLSWPLDNFGDDIWVMSVDGVHFKTYEKRSDRLNLDPALFCYKHKCAGFNYEIGISLATSKIVWFNGPFESGSYNDIKIFATKGLLSKLRAHNKRAIGDGGYRGYPDCMSTPNIKYDKEEVRNFKSRARMRHERFNAMLKTFKVLDDKFRSDKTRLQHSFEAVAAICQYKMDLEAPLYDV